MKKLIFVLAFILQAAFVSASGDQELKQARASYDNIKMYRQPGTSTEVLKALRSSDELMLIRKHNANWSIVTVDGQVGYVLTSELRLVKDSRNIALARPAGKK